MKPCTKCKEVKEDSEFSSDQRNKCGLQSACRDCQRNANRERYKENRDEANRKARIWRDENRDHVRQRSRNHYLKIKNDPTWKAQHRVFVNQWKVNNQDKVREINRKHDAKKMETVRGHLSHAISRNINNSIRRGSKGGRKWEILVGYTTDQLKRHLEGKFAPEMSWENYGSYWHIDHKIPESAFNFETPEDLDFKKCWSLKNLQPMESRKNMVKGSMVDKPFQPSLMLAAI